MLTSFSTFLEDKRETDRLYDLAVEGVALGFRFDEFCQWYWDEGQYLPLNEAEWPGKVGRFLGGLGSAAVGSAAGAIKGAYNGIKGGWNWMNQGQNQGQQILQDDPQDNTQRQSQVQKTQEAIKQAHQSLTQLAQDLYNSNSMDGTLLALHSNGKSIENLQMLLTSIMRRYKDYQSRIQAYNTQVVPGLRDLGGIGDMPQNPPRLRSRNVGR